MQPSISVIVPLYNAEKWLHRCLSSLESQTFKDLEILLIDDGSTDNSGSICDSFAAKDTRAKVFHTPNRGVSEARQLGLDQASGLFMIYLDADDFIAPTMYEEMFNAAITAKADLVFCDWISIEGPKAYCDNLNINKWCAKNLLARFLYDQPVYLPIVLFRRSLFHDLSVSFPCGRLNYGEDTIVMIDLLAKSIKQDDSIHIIHLPHNLYVYDKTINVGSLMKPTAKVLNQSQIRVWEMIGPLIDEDTFGKYYYGRLVSYLFNAYWNNLYSLDEYGHYAQYYLPIRRFAPWNAKKIISLFLLSGKLDFARRIRFISFPTILQEKIAIQKRSHRIIHNLPIPPTNA